MKASNMVTIAILNNGILTVEQIKDSIDVETYIADFHGDDVQWSVITDVVMNFNKGVD